MSVIPASLLLGNSVFRRPPETPSSDWVEHAASPAETDRITHLRAQLGIAAADPLFFWPEAADAVALALGNNVDRQRVIDLAQSMLSVWQTFQSELTPYPLAEPGTPDETLVRISGTRLDMLDILFTPYNDPTDTCVAVRALLPIVSPRIIDESSEPLDSDDLAELRVPRPRKYGEHATPLPEVMREHTTYLHPVAKT